MRLHITTLSTCILLTSSLAAYAQDGEDGEVSGAGAPADGPAITASEQNSKEPTTGTDTAVTAPLTSEAGADGGRFRFGVALGAGPLFTDGIDMTYYGVDLRFGWQLNDALAVYAQPQLGYYKLDGASALFGSGGLIGASVVADYTLFDRAFVGAGVGYGILNSPSGAEVHLRAGGYPLMWRSDSKIRRRAIMLGVDFRMHFVEGYTFIAPTFNVGYDAF
jgi:hypothetical protein